MIFELRHRKHRQYFLCRQIEEKELEIVIDRTGRRNIQDRILGISFHPVRL